MSSPRLAMASSLVLVASAVPMLATWPAAADSPGCATSREFDAVEDGMSVAKVHRILDTSGTSLFENPGVEHNSAREYPMCAAWKRATGDTTVQVQYNNYATSGGPQRVAHKQHY